MEQKYKIISLQEEDEKNQNDFNIESFHPTPTAEEKTLTKPDFSLILSEETQFRFKTNGSYKKRKFLMPETPIKLIKKNYSTSIKIEGKDLFNIKKDKSFCRKLHFDDDEEAKTFYFEMTADPKNPAGNRRTSGKRLRSSAVFSEKSAGRRLCLRNPRGSYQTSRNAPGTGKPERPFRLQRILAG